MDQDRSQRTMPGVIPSKSKKWDSFVLESRYIKWKSEKVAVELKCSTPILTMGSWLKSIKIYSITCGCLLYSKLYRTAKLSSLCMLRTWDSSLFSISSTIPSPFPSSRVASWSVDRFYLIIFFFRFSNSMKNLKKLYSSSTTVNKKWGKSNFLFSSALLVFVRFLSLPS